MALFDSRELVEPMVALIRRQILISVYKYKHTRLLSRDNNMTLYTQSNHKEFQNLQCFWYHHSADSTTS